jgi:hypothetical protein
MVWLYTIINFSNKNRLFECSYISIMLIFNYNFQSLKMDTENRLHFFSLFPRNDCILVLVFFFCDNYLCSIVILLTHCTCVPFNKFSDEWLNDGIVTAMPWLMFLKGTTQVNWLHSKLWKSCFYLNFRFALRNWNFF